MKTTLTTWLVLFGLLLQSAAWALPAQQAAQAERLAHQVTHALDHGHHPHEGMSHEADATLALPTDLAEPAHGGHGPHHTHASEGVQFQGWPVTQPLAVLNFPRSAPQARAALQPPSADLAGLLRPPQLRV